MANEIDVRASLQVRFNNFIYQSNPVNFIATLTRYKGPSPGVVAVPITGVRINLSELVQPGICRIFNQDTVNFVTVGVYDSARFYPLLELPPQESYIIRLSRYLNQEFVGTSTGTNADANQLMMIADTAACNVLVECFDT